MARKRMSMTKIGKAFERLTVKTLKPLGFLLTHCGKPGDGGIDFIGYWDLPDKKVAVAGQCKYTDSTTMFSRKVMSEMEGSLLRLERKEWYRTLASAQDTKPLAQGEFNTVGMLVTSVGFTSNAVKYLHTSDLPLVMAQVMVGESNTKEADSDNPAEELYEAWKQWSQGGGSQPARRPQKRKSGSENNEGKTVKSSSRSESHRTSRSRLLELKGPPSGLRGFVTGFLMNRRAMLMMGDVHLCWKYDTSHAEQQVQWVDPLLFYNGMEVSWQSSS